MENEIKEGKENLEPQAPEENKPKDELSKSESENTDYEAELEKKDKALEDAQFAVMRAKKKNEELVKQLEEAGIEVKKEGISEEAIANIVESRLETLKKGFESKLSELARMFKSKDGLSTTASGAGQKPLQEQKPPEPTEDDKKILKHHPDWVYSFEKKRYISPILEKMEKGGRKVRGGVTE